VAEHRAVPKPSEFTLGQNFPNPFNPATTIEYAVPHAADVTLTIYNVTGQLVARLVSQRQKPGCYQVSWEAMGLANGLYICALTADGLVKTSRMVLLK
jgi:hypothetical protein